MAAVDIQLKAAYFCVQCDVVTSAKHNCMRCGGPVYPLSRWLLPMADEPENKSAESLDTSPRT